MRVHPYLNFDGDCAEAFRFYARVLGGSVEMMTGGDSPMADDMPGMRERVMHACLTAGELVLMASDTPPGMYERPRGLYVSLHIAEPRDAERIFNQLAEGGTITMPIAPTFWAERFGMLTDRFGTPWMINCAKTPGASAAAK